MTFGNNGFLGYTPCTTSTSTTSLTASQLRGETTVPRGDMGFWWARSAHADPKMEPDVEKTKADLLKRMQGWKDANIRSILEHSHRTAMIATYALPRQETWAGRRVVLVGDAAHGESHCSSFQSILNSLVLMCTFLALPTSSGQGVSQSLEDAEALAMLLAQNLSSGSGEAVPSTSGALQKTFQQYMAVRKAHVERILDAGNRGGDASRDMSFVAEYTMYAFFWVMRKLPFAPRCNECRADTGVVKFFSRLFTKEVETYDVVKEVEKVVR